MSTETVFGSVDVPEKEIGSVQTEQMSGGFALDTFLSEHNMTTNKKDRPNGHFPHAIGA